AIAGRRRQRLVIIVESPRVVVTAALVKSCQPHVSGPILWANLDGFQIRLLGIVQTSPCFECYTEPAFRLGGGRIAPNRAAGGFGGAFVVSSALIDKPETGMCFGQPLVQAHGLFARTARLREPACFLRDSELPPVALPKRSVRGGVC